jgi:hypothetical protein
VPFCADRASARPLLGRRGARLGGRVAPARRGCRRVTSRQVLGGAERAQRGIPRRLAVARRRRVARALAGGRGFSPPFSAAFSSPVSSTALPPTASRRRASPPPSRRLRGRLRLGLGRRRREWRQAGRRAVRRHPARVGEHRAVGTRTAWLPTRRPRYLPRSTVSSPGLYVRSRPPARRRARRAPANVSRFCVTSRRKARRSPSSASASRAAAPSPRPGGTRTT